MTTYLLSTDCIDFDAHFFVIDPLFDLDLEVHFDAVSCIGLREVIADKQDEGAKWEADGIDLRTCILITSRHPSNDQWSLSLKGQDALRGK